MSGFSTSLRRPSARLDRSSSSCEEKYSPRCVTVLHMSEEDDEDDGAVSDELSKLIGKRASMLKKKAPTSKPVDEDFVDPNTASLYEGKTGMDIFEMPDFSSSRPLRTPKEMEEKGRGSENEDDEYYVDYQAEYEDENDLHVPNRMGFSTKAWGDRDAGFRSGKKLKKKGIKAGKFLAGDLQVCAIRSLSYHRFHFGVTLLQRLPFLMIRLHMTNLWKLESYMSTHLKTLVFLQEPSHYLLNKFYVNALIRMPRLYLS